LCDKGFESLLFFIQFNARKASMTLRALRLASYCGISMELILATSHCKVFASDQNCIGRKEIQ
jgi:hypothetical protein